MPKVSVIVPVYNVEKYLDKCLDSLVNQTLEDIEIIVVNDGTKDNSQSIIDKYKKKYSKKIKSYIKENGGLSSARNYGLKYAKGNYIAFVDSDDYVDLKMFERMYSEAKNNKFDIVVCDTINVYEEKEVYIKSNLGYSNNDINNYIISPPMACSRIYSKKIFEKNKFKEGIFYEDLELTPSFALYTNRIGFLKEGLYFYLQRTGSIMKQKKFNNRLLDIFDVLEKNYNLLYKDYSKEVEYMYITHLLRTATLRFLDYDKKEYLYKINKIMREKFPNWNKNIYYKKSSKKLKLICFLAYHKKYKTLKLIKKITNK